MSPKIQQIRAKERAKPTTTPAYRILYPKVESNRVISKVISNQERSTMGSKDTWVLSGRHVNQSLGSFPSKGDKQSEKAPKELPIIVRIFVLYQDIKPRQIL